MMGHLREHEQHREIAIFWDYDNVPLPPWCSPAEASKRIHEAVSKYGRVVERRVYFDFAKRSAEGPCRDCSRLDLSGYDLVNAPARNSKETLDKKLITDVLTFAWDSSVRNVDRKPCVVLLTSDGDYAYTLAKLRARGVMNVVMFGWDCSGTQILVENADVALSFENDVLAPARKDTVSIAGSDTGGNYGKDATPYVFLKNLPRSVEIRELVQFLESSLRTPGCVIRVSIQNTSNPMAAWCFAHIEFISAKDGARMISLASSNGLAYGGRDIHACADTKVPSSAFFSKLDPSLCYVKKGVTDSQERSAPLVSKEDTAYVCLENMPLTTKSADLVQFFKETLSVTTQWIDRDYPADKDAGSCCVHLEFVSAQDGARVIQRSRSDVGTGLTFEGKPVRATIDTEMPSAVSIPKRKHFFGDRASSSAASFCCCLYNCQQSRAAGASIPFEQCWVTESSAAIMFQKMAERFVASKKERKELHRILRDQAIENGFAEAGRRKVDDERRNILCVPWFENRGLRDDLSPESYLRLTTKGRSLCENLSATEISPVGDLPGPATDLFGGNAGQKMANEAKGSVQTSLGVENNGLGPEVPKTEESESLGEECITTDVVLEIPNELTEQTTVNRMMDVQMKLVPDGDQLQNVTDPFGEVNYQL